MPPDSRMHILQMIEDGQVTGEEGLRLLEALSGARREHDASTEAAPSAEAPAPPVAPSLGQWKNWWKIPLAIGIGITLVGSGLMYWAYRAGGLGFWFACAAAPFALGVLVVALSWGNRTSKWLHVRVLTGQTEWPRRIAISMPLPVRLTAWALRTFGRHIPQLRQTGVDELILALNETTSPDAPLFVDVTGDEGGERVQVYLG